MDRKIPQPAAGTPTVIAYYTPDVQSTMDYYAFGSEMKGRTFSNGAYRYGFNGKENDDEVKGMGISRIME